MDIHQTINSQNLGTDLNQLNRQNPQAGTRTALSRELENEDVQTVGNDAATVSLSEKGREAAASIDFDAVDENMSKLTALGDTGSLAKSHGFISYARVKELLN